MGVRVLEYVRGVEGCSGSGFGSNSTAEDVTAGLSLSHLTLILTGGTSGIGAEAARVLAKRGARIVLPARNVKAAEAIAKSIQSETAGARILVFSMDLTSLSSVRHFVARFMALNLPLNLLINNAGVVCRRYKLSEDGYEMDFATNHLGHFLLTSLLLNKMVETAKQSGVEGRIVNVSSSLHTWIRGKPIDIDFHRLNDKNSFVESLNYAHSKLANILHANELARRLKENGSFVTANSLHPGIVRTNITRDRHGLITDIMYVLASLFTKSIPQGASTLCYVAVHPKVKGVSGKYFVDCNEASSSSLAYDSKLAQKLWLYSEKLTQTNYQ